MSELFNSELFNSLVGNIAWVLVTGVFGVVVAVSSSYTRRRRLCRFFGLSRSKRDVTAYLSSVNVRPWGSLGPGGVPAAFFGAAVPEYEIEAVRPFAAIWESSRLDRLSNAVRTQLQKISWVFGPIKPFVAASPSSVAQLAHGGAILTVGSHAYNTATQYAFGPLRSTLLIDDGNAVKQIDRSTNTITNAWSYVPAIVGHGGTDYAIVERITVRATQTTYLVVAGLTKVGTKGAIALLSSRWDRLAKISRCTDFSICLRFEDIDVDPASYSKPAVVQMLPAPTTRWRGRPIDVQAALS